MKINGQEVDPSTIAEIAGKYDLRHSDKCRDANRRQFPFTCRCTFFEEVSDYLPELAEDPSAAKAEARRLYGEGYRQVSRKYRALAKLDLSKKYFDDATRIEVSPTVFTAFREISPEAKLRSEVGKYLRGLDRVPKRKR